MLIESQGVFSMHSLFVQSVGYQLLKVKDSSRRTKYLMTPTPFHQTVRVNLNVNTKRQDAAHAVGVTCLLPHSGVSSNDFPCLETLCKKIMKEKQPFERLEIKKETLLEMFKVSKSSTPNVKVPPLEWEKWNARPSFDSTTSSSVASWTRRSLPRPPPSTGEATSHCGFLEWLKS